MTFYYKERQGTNGDRIFRYQIQADNGNGRRWRMLVSLSRQ